MDKSKMFAITAAFMMLAVAGIAIVNVSGESDATDLDQTINVYYYKNGSWTYSSEQKYNLYEAIESAGTASTFGVVSTAVGNDNWDSSGNPNMSYGLISTIGGSSSFVIEAYDGATWQDVTSKPLGWIRPFSDYGANVSIPGMTFSASANVAIIFGSESTAGIDDTTLQLMPSVQGCDDMLYKFTLKDNTNSLSFSNVSVKYKNSSNVVVPTTISASDIQNGNTFDVYGYGSDAYLALKDAVGSALAGQLLGWQTNTNPNTGATYYTYYSWMSTLFGAGTVSEFGYDEDLEQNYSKYTYWASYTGTGGYLLYNFGWYSQLPGAYNGGSEFKLTYEVSIYYY